MRPRRVFPEKEALYFIAFGKDKDTFEKKFMSEEKGKLLPTILPSIMHDFAILNSCLRVGFKICS